MSLRRRDPGHDELGDGLLHYLTSGCWRGATLTPEEKWEMFTLSSSVLGGRFDRLRGLWREVGVFVKASHAAETYAEKVLKLPEGAGLEAAKLSERLRCRAHPV